MWTVNFDKTSLAINDLEYVHNDLVAFCFKSLAHKQFMSLEFKSCGSDEMIIQTGHNLTTEPSWHVYNYDLIGT